MFMQQMTIFEIEQPVPIQQADKIYSPSELHQQGIAWTMKDAERWEAEIWKVYKREWSNGNIINWFQAIEIYRAERDGK
jgi:hypothetical protein